MWAMRIQNFRCIQDTGYLPLKPVTLLLGRNSSGKSTFLRLLPLLKQSVDRRTRGPILWNGPLVKFGSYEEAVRGAAEGRNFAFGFQIHDWLLEFTLDHARDARTTYISHMLLRHGDHSAALRFGQDGRLTHLDDAPQADGTAVRALFRHTTDGFPAIGLRAALQGDTPGRDLLKYIFELMRVHYTQPFRSSARRSYARDELLVEDVDPDGANLAMVLHSFSAEHLAAFNTWTQTHFGFSVEVHLLGPNVSLHLREARAGGAHNLADTGFGYSQILPIITQLWMLSATDARAHAHHAAYRMPIHYIVEQPELHLHPQLQAQLMDAFVTAAMTAKQRGIDLHLLIETHSEDMVNRLGHHVCFHESFGKDDAAVYLFQRPDAEAPTRVTEAPFDEEGILQNWPLGFFSADHPG